MHSSLPPSTLAPRNPQPETRNLVVRDLDVLWHPCSQMSDYRDYPPLEVVAAQGCRLRLADGRELLDAISSWWCRSLGHQHPRLVAALKNQADRFSQVILANTTNDQAVRFCERILAVANGYGPDAWGPDAAPGRLPGWFGKTFLADNGSTAVEIALKMALHAHRHRGNTRRTRFAALADGYHGETVGALSVGDCGIYADPYRPLLFGCLQLGPLPLRAGPHDPLWQDASAEWPAIQAQLDAQADELAAIIYEPVLQGAGGMRLFSPDLLRHLRAWADAHDVYLIADEIAAGMGRCGRMLAGEWATVPPGSAFGVRRSALADAVNAVPTAARNVDEARNVRDTATPNADTPSGHLRRTPNGCFPDFAVLSKGLTGGELPLSCVLVPDHLHDLFLGERKRAFLHSNTWSGNALALAVANAVLDEFAEANVLGHVARTGPGLLTGLEKLAATRPYLRNVRGIGMMAAVDLCRLDGSPCDPVARTGWRVFQAAAECGALLRPLGDTMYVLPPLNTSAEDCAAMVAVLAAACDAVLGRSP